jgi:hypothetical protein
LRTSESSIVHQFHSVEDVSPTEETNDFVPIRLTISQYDFTSALKSQLPTAKSADQNKSALLRLVLFFQLADVLNRIFGRAHDSPWMSPVAITIGKKIQSISIFRIGQPPPRSRSGSSIFDSLSKSVVFNQPASPI